MDNRLINRTLELLNRNFKGVSVITRSNAYNKMDEVIPSAELKVEKGNNDMTDIVKFNFGSTNCIYKFIWGDSTFEKRQRLIRIEPIKETISIVRTYAETQPKEDEVCLVNSSGNTFTAKYNRGVGKTWFWEITMGEHKPIECQNEDTWIPINELVMKN